VSGKDMINIEDVEKLIEEVKQVIKDHGLSGSTEDYIKAVHIVRNYRNTAVILSEERKYLNKGYFRIH
jgi:hypothetical protein